MSSTPTSTSTFLQSVHRGELQIEDIDDFVDAWHAGTDARELRDAIGLTQAQYKSWLTGRHTLGDFLAPQEKARHAHVEM